MTGRGRLFPTKCIAAMLAVILAGFHMFGIAWTLWALDYASFVFSRLIRACS